MLPVRNANQKHLRREFNLALCNANRTLTAFAKGIGVAPQSVCQWFSGFTSAKISNAVHQVIEREFAKMGMTPSFSGGWKKTPRPAVSAKKPRAAESAGRRAA